MAAAPQWAQNLLLRALLYWQEQHGGDVPLPELRWRRRRGLLSSGREYLQSRIIITAGTDRRDQKLVLLHETAHALAPMPEAHSATFWDIAWELYRWARLPLRYAREREALYRRGSVVAYIRSRARARAVGARAKEK